jgi:hypothetical protein
MGVNKVERQAQRNSEQTKSEEIGEPVHHVLLSPQQPIPHTFQVADDRKGIHPHAHTEERTEKVKVEGPSPDSS